MKRTATMLIMLAALGGCMSSPRKNDQVAQVGCGGRCGRQRPTVPGTQDAYGQPVPMVQPYASAPPGAMAAQAMMANSVPLRMVQMPTPAGMPPMAAPSPTSGMMQAGAYMAPGADSGVMQAGYGAPPMAAPNPIPSGPGCIAPPGVPFAPPGIPPGMGRGPMQAGFIAPLPGVVAAEGGAPVQGPSGPKRTEVRFSGPAGMKVSWYGIGPNGQPGFGTNQIEVPGRYNFLQAAIYRLKLSDIPNRPGVDLYPTLEVVPSSHRTDAFIAHSAVPVYFTEDDFDQVAAGNFLVKVIYLPYPQYQDIAAAGIEEIVSTRLEPGIDPIQEACKRGSILLIVRLGNIDLEAPNTPAMDAPGPNGGGVIGGPGGMPGGMPGCLPAMPGVPMSAGPGMPMMNGGMPMPPGNPMPSMRVSNPPQPPAAPGVPITKLPDVTSVQPTYYPSANRVPTPAQLAGQ